MVTRHARVGKRIRERRQFTEIALESSKGPVLHFNRSQGSHATPSRLQLSAWPSQPGAPLVGYQSHPSQNLLIAQHFSVMVRQLPGSSGHHGGREQLKRLARALEFADPFPDFPGAVRVRRQRKP